ncbi:hypothetical protein RCO27_09055 [Sphingosinicella sp. LHD-64]|uniref:hypothetical protein n=1 Tax=Sphingosinicella sp. LHD-64 TaxID=3072139 RepID=UPI00280C51EE|nr:hypothetical protein [Sphingosinicella sp. LHD-64]MDQ8756377.1 hypothetical protein [Sphingosinicella sp. LHD-64]
MGRSDVAFLFLGEMLLAPHLWPIVDALARRRPDLPIDLWVSTSAHEDLVADWLGPQHRNVRLRRAPGFLKLNGFEPGRNPPLPAKMPMLARLAPRLIGTRVVVCAEQTSLWLPRLLPAKARYLFTVHGAGPLNYNRDGRLRYAARLLVPSGFHTTDHLAHGIRAERIVETGYAKASFRPSLRRGDLFADDRPVLLYTPHWQRYCSSWWDWGREIVERLVAQDRYNVVLAPHQRLFERDPGALAVLAAAGEAPHVHVDTGSFAMVDGSYTEMADLYVGDVSSQIVEYLARPRPCVLLEAPNMSWREGAEDYQGCGDVVRDHAAFWPTIEAAAGRHPLYEPFQTAFVARALGDATAAAPARAAEEIVQVLAEASVASQETSFWPRARAMKA